MNATMPNGIGSRLDECPAAQKEADRLIVDCGKAVDRGQDAFMNATMPNGIGSRLDEWKQTD